MRLHKGTLHPFSGPIYKQDGSLLIAKGKSLTDADLVENQLLR